MKEVITKIYVKVQAVFSEDGELTPTRIIWSDGRVFQIDRIRCRVRAASLKAGGAGIRYTCLINGKEHFLFYEENYKWFVEGRTYMNTPS